MSQDGSFPGRPRGRRARHASDASQWQGYEATPADEREFPDLDPIRPRDARARDGRVQPDRQGQEPGHPGHGGRQRGAHAAGGGGYPADGAGYQDDAPGYQSGTAGYQGGSAGYQGGAAGYPGSATGYQGGPFGYPGGAPGYPPTGPGQAGADPFGTGPFAADRVGTGPFTTGASFGAGQPGTQQRPQGSPGGFSQPAQAQAGATQAGQPQAPKAKQSEEDIPEWAEPDSAEAFSERWRRRGLDSRDDRRADRRKRRQILFAGGGVGVVVIAVAVYFLFGNGSSATPGFGNLITSFLPGELQQVPDACNTVPASMLNQYLDGTRKIAQPPLNAGANTQCTWTLDSPPTYRVLEVQIEAYSPSALYGNGSATDAAELNYASFQQGFAKPGPKSGQPAATVTDVSGMPGGTQTSAFQATQVFNREGATTDVANILVRYRNVIITVVVDGLDQAKGKKQYGPVSMGDLTSAAKSVAQQVAGQVVG